MISQSTLFGQTHSGRAKLLGPLALAVLGVALFLPHWLGQGTFVGDADRINTLLNIRKHSVDSIRELGRVSTWNERMFCGYPTSGLHWMVPELDPFAYLQACLPEGSLFQVCGYLSCLLVICAGWSFFALARCFALDVFPGTVGASLYMMSSFAVNRIVQVDWAYALLIAIPLGLMILKRIEPASAVGSNPAAADRNWRNSFLCLVGISVFLIVFTFLQEVAYVFLLFGLFAIHQSLRGKTWAPLLILCGAFAAACVISLPRLINVAEDFQLLDRSHAFQTTNTVEILRWFNDGIFGRYVEEAWANGNRLNLHEGCQFYATTFATLLLVVGAIRFGTWLHLATRVVFFGVFTLALWEITDEITVRSWLLIASYVLVTLSTERTRLLSAALLSVFCIIVLRKATLPPHYLVGGYFGLLALGFAWRKNDQHDDRFHPSDIAFFYLMISLCMAIILFPAARQVIYLLFCKIDFTHSRITIAALAPLALLAAQLLQELYYQNTFSLRSLYLGFWSYGVGLVLGGLALLSATVGSTIWLTIRPIKNDLTLPCTMQLLRAETCQLAICGVLFGMFFIALQLFRSHAAIVRGVVYGFGILLVGHCFANAYFQMAGPQTWNYPVPFRGHNYSMVPAQALHDPDNSRNEAVRRTLETDKYRTAFIADPEDFCVYVEPHMADFWHLRVLGGYSAGVPKRQAHIPWPAHVRHLRSVSFTDAGMINWRLLSVLNTKYVVFLDSAFYYNVQSHNTCLPGYDLHESTILQNPMDVVPRVFFTKSIRPASDRTGSLAKDAQLVPPNLHLTRDSPKEMRLEWQHPAQDQDLAIVLQVKKPYEDVFHTMTVGRVSVAQGFLPIGSFPPGEYTFRAFVEKGDCKSDSKDIAVTLQPVALAKPTGLQAKRLSATQVQLSWNKEPGCSYVLEKAEGDVRTFAPIECGQEITMIVAETSVKALGFRIRAVRDGQTSPHSKPVWLPPLGVSPEDEHSVAEKFPLDPRAESMVEGIDHQEHFSTAGTFTAQFQGDRIVIDMEPQETDRFLVLNESYHPRWRARCDGKEVRVFPTNGYMRGVLVPAGTSCVQFEFVPFSHTPLAMAIVSLGLGLMLLGTVWIGRLSYHEPEASQREG